MHPSRGLSQTCELFSIMLLDTEKFMKMGVPPKRVKGGAKIWVPLKDHFSSSDPYFINSWHEFCFKQSWPRVYQVLFQNPRLNFPDTLFNFQRQVFPHYDKLLNELLPFTRESLVKWPQIYAAAVKRPVPLKIKEPAPVESIFASPLGRKNVIM